MKILWVIRKRTLNAFSIEKVFLNIEKEMRKLTDVEIFEANSRKYFLKDIIQLWGKKSDILHITGDITNYAIFLPRRKLMITIHDIGHYVNTLQGMKKRIYGCFWIRLPIKKAKHVTCVSKKTYDDLKKYFPKEFDSTKFTVVENSYPPEFKYTEKLFFKTKPRILQVGTSSYKNIEKVIQALNEIPCIFVLIGNLTDEQKKLLLENNVEYENYFNLDEMKLFEEYKKADMVTFVSTGEGFGLPIVEAQAAGRVLITSDISPLKDIAGDGAYLVDPANVKEIRDSIKKVIDDDNLRNKLIERGLKNVQRYSPINVTEKYLNIYKEFQND